MNSAAPAWLWERATRPDTLLDMLQQTSPEFRNGIALDLRRFACWCARAAGAAGAGPLSHRVLHAAETYAAGTLPAALLAAERRSAAGLASGAGTIGLRLRKPVAALQLAAIRTADENPFEAARAAAHFASRAAVLRDGDSAGAVVSIRQAAALRFFVPNPFVSEARRDVIVA